jgi:hypothetical protein
VVAARQADDEHNREEEHEAGPRAGPWLAVAVASCLLSQLISRSVVVAESAL